MRRVTSVVVLVVLSFAAAHAVGKPKKTLKHFLPDKLGDVKRERPLPPGLGMAPSDDAHASYLLPERRFVNINLMWVKDLSFEKAQFRVHAPGETNGDHEGFDVQDRRHAVGRNAKTPNEALEWLQKVDLKSLAAFAPSK